MLWFLPDFKKRPDVISAINGLVQVKKKYGSLAVITEGDITQSGGELHLMWSALIRNLPHKSLSPSCLVLGVGGGTMIQLLRKRFPKSSITGIEIDPVMLELAEKYFLSKKDSNTVLIQADAIKYLSKGSLKKYDIILVDIFIGPLNPESSRRLTFIKHIKRSSSSTGVILYNAHFRSEKEHRELLQVFSTEFTQVTEVFSYPLNRVLKLTI